MLAGLLAIFHGVALGLTQRQPGALLTYSSISQMGHFSLALGADLLAPALWPLLLPVVVLYALHHALAKAPCSSASPCPRSRWPARHSPAACW